MATASLQETDPEPRCYKNPLSTGTRIDAILCNSSLAYSLCGCAVSRDSGLPTHCPVAASFKSEVYGQHVHKIAKPKAVPADAWNKWEPEEEQDLAVETLLQYEKQWQKARAADDVLKMQTTWSMAVETYLIKGSEASIGEEDARNHKGRHKDEAPTQFYLVARQLPETWGGQTVKQWQVQRMARRAEQMYRQVKRLEGRGPGQPPHALRQLWANLRADGTSHAIQEVQSIIWEQEAVPTSEICSQIIKALQVRIQQDTSERRRERTRLWRKTVQEQYSQGSRGKGSV